MSQPVFFAHPFHGTLRAGRTNRLPVVEATFVFADVVGSTVLAERLGERGAYSVIRRFCGLVRDLSECAGGEALELRGDGALLAFPASARAGLETACELQRVCARAGEISLRIGVNEGTALRLERGYFGRALTLAGRLADAAGAGEILVSDSVVQATGSKTRFARGAEFGPARQLHLKGFEETVKVHRLEWHPFSTAAWRRHASATGASLGAEAIS